ncbi:DUF1905 domain-containing protein [Pimelobacter simplex]|uniref:DUF1905 domain-containing protein n=1 Tax=Nocardioides simplex TaxID=2045 RepID=UPI0038053088
MEFTFSGPVVEWRGPAPYFFVEVPDEQSEDIKEAARGLEYWGQVAVDVRIAGTDFRTALFPKDGRYLVPLRAAVRREAGLELGQVVEAALDLAPRG